jgi:hypothetical protein
MTFSGYKSLLVLFIGIALQAGCLDRSAVTQKAVNGLSIAEAVRLTPANIDASEPGIAADDTGNLFIVFAEHLNGRSSDIKLLRRDRNGKELGDAIRVNHSPGEATVWAGDPPTIAVRGQAVYIAWTRKPGDPKARGNDLVLSVSRDSGMTFDPPVRVNDDVEPASHGMHALAVGENGVVIMLWLDERWLVGKAAPTTGSYEMAEPNAEAYYAISKDGGRSFGANIKLAADVCPCCKATLLIDRDNTIYAAWRQVLEGEYRHIAVARSDNGGETFNKPVIVSDDKWQINACPVSGAALLARGGGTLDVFWYTAGGAGQAGLYYSRSTDRGDSFASRILVSNKGTAGTPSASFAGEEGVVVFPAADGGMSIASWKDSPVSQSTRGNIADAILPSMVTSGGRTSIVFVRTVDSKRSVWIQQG